MKQDLQPIDDVYAKSTGISDNKVQLFGFFFFCITSCLVSANAFAQAQTDQKKKYQVLLQPYLMFPSMDEKMRIGKLPYMRCIRSDLC